MNLNNMSGHEFEEFIEKLIQKMGFVTEERRKSADGGIDLKAINEVGGIWEIIVLKEGRSFLLSILQEMGKGGLANVRGSVYLFGFQGIDQDLVQEIKSASSGNLYVLMPAADVAKVQSGGVS